MTKESVQDNGFNIASFLGWDNLVTIAGNEIGKDGRLKRLSAWGKTLAIKLCLHQPRPLLGIGQAVDVLVSVENPCLRMRA